MSPITSLFTEPADPLHVQLAGEHRVRYEQIKAWRESQTNPHFNEVPPQWHKDFGEKPDH